MKNFFACLLWRPPTWLHLGFTWILVHWSNLSQFFHCCYLFRLAYNFWLLGFFFWYLSIPHCVFSNDHTLIAVPLSICADNWFHTQSPDISVTNSSCYWNSLLVFETYTIGWFLMVLSGMDLFGWVLTQMWFTSPKTSSAGMPSEMGTLGRVSS